MRLAAALLLASLLAAADGGSDTYPQGDNSDATGGSVEARVASLVSQMTAAEKHSLMNGIGWNLWELQDGFYVGNTPAIKRLVDATQQLPQPVDPAPRPTIGPSILPLFFVAFYREPECLSTGPTARACVTRLGIPSLNMMDAGQGFRTIDPRQVGQVTSWSCALGLASTWDVDLVYVGRKSAPKHRPTVSGAPRVSAHPCNVQGTGSACGRACGRLHWDGTPGVRARAPAKCARCSDSVPGTAGPWRPRRSSRRST